MVATATAAVVVVMVLTIVPAEWNFTMLNSFRWFVYTFSLLKIAENKCNHYCMVSDSFGVHPSEARLNHLLGITNVHLFCQLAKNHLKAVHNCSIWHIDMNKWLNLLSPVHIHSSFCIWAFSLPLSRCVYVCLCWLSTDQDMTIRIGRMCTWVSKGCWAMT